MRYCRFKCETQQILYGAVESVQGNDTITKVISWSENGTSHTKSIEPILLENAKLLAPIQPSKIIGVGRNYREHASELGNEVPVEPLLFLKATSSIIASGEEVILPPSSVTQRVDFEGELGVVIGKRCRNLSAEADVREFIRGYTCVNDITARDLQKIDGQWTRAKGFDTFCPVGPIVSDEIDPWKGVEVRTLLNGTEKQHGNTSDFIFPLDAIIRYISGFMTLEPGDLISTGTPAGVGPMKAGDVVEVTITGIGTLRNTIA